MITTLLYLVIVAIVCAVILWLAQQIPGVAQFAGIIRVVVIAIFIIYCIYILISMVGGGHVPALK